MIRFQTIDAYPFGLVTYHSEAQPNSPAKFPKATSIIGHKIQNLEGENLGSVKDIMIDVETGRIEYVVVELGGFLGLGERFTAIQYPLLKLDGKNQCFILHQEKAVLMDAPGFDKDHWPETNTHMFDSSGGYWVDLWASIPARDTRS